MTREIRRGHPFPDGWSHKQAQELGPYPIWDAWKSTIEKRFSQKLEKLNNGGRGIVQEAYTLRRLIQLHRKKLDDWFVFLTRIDQEHPDFLDENSEIIRFIVERTEANGVREKAASRPRRK